MAQRIPPAETDFKRLISENQSKFLPHSDLFFSLFDSELLPFAVIETRALLLVIYNNFYEIYKIYITCSFYFHEEASLSPRP